MSRSRPFLVVLFALAALAAGTSAWLSLSTKDRLPSVNYTRLDGRPANTDALRGKVVLVNFWATSCTSCVAEMPRIVETHEKFKARGFDTLAVAMSYDPPAQVVRFAQTRRLPFDVAIDNTGAIAREFGRVQLTPTTLLVKQNGEIVRRYVGTPDFEALQALVEDLLQPG